MSPRPMKATREPRGARKRRPTRPSTHEKVCLPLEASAPLGRVALSCGAGPVVAGADQDVQASRVVLPATGRQAVEAVPFDRRRLDRGVEAELSEHWSAIGHGNVEVHVHDVGGEADAVLPPFEVPQEAEVKVAKDVGEGLVDRNVHDAFHRNVALEPREPHVGRRDEVPLAIHGGARPGLGRHGRARPLPAPARRRPQEPPDPLRCSPSFLYLRCLSFVDIGNPSTRRLHAAALDRVHKEDQREVVRLLQEWVGSADRRPHRRAPTGAGW